MTTSRDLLVWAREFSGPGSAGVNELAEALETAEAERDRLHGRLDRVHDLLSELYLDSPTTREGTAWGSILREAKALSEADTAPREDRALRAEPDYSYIYWRDPVEGCWVAYQRADCVGDEELPTQKLPMDGGSHE